MIVEPLAGRYGSIGRDPWERTVVLAATIVAA